jgi:copper transport protein
MALGLSRRLRERTGMRVRVSRLAVATLAVFALAAASAYAHAYPITTSPAIGGLVKTSPATVSITYDEGVTVPALAVYDAAGKLVSGTAVGHPAPDKIEVDISGRLADGTYTVAWRVTSADTHVVHGVYTFSVGRRGNAGAIAAKLRARERVREGLAFGFGVVRFLNLALLLLCAGGAISLLWVLQEVDGSIRRTLLRALTVAGVLLAIVAVLGLPFEGAEANDTGLGGGFSKAALSAVRHERFGEVWLVRAWLAAVFALLALSLQTWERRWRLGRDLLLAAMGVCLLLTSTDSGHASVSGPLAFVADGVHITGAAVWLGGLAFLLAAIGVSASGQRWTLAAASVPRFSTTAMVAVPLLGAAGILSAYLEVRAWRGLWETTYGLLILAKVGVVLPVLALGAFNNRVTVPALRGGVPSPAMRARCVRAIGAELGLLLVIIGVTTALIDEAPAKNAVKPAAQASSFTATGTAGPFKVRLTLRPAVVGVDKLSATVTSARHLTISAVYLTAVPPAGRSRPVYLGVFRLSPSLFKVLQTPLGVPGRWSLEMTVRQGLTEYLARFPLTITSR